MRARWKRTGAVVGSFALLAIILAVAVVLTPGTGNQVGAQDSATPAASPTAKKGANAYQDFVTKLAANLGISDPTKVDAAIKTTLNQMVDEQAAAGHIQQDAATKLKERIDKGAFAKAFTAFLKNLEKSRHDKSHAKPKSTPSVEGTPAV